MFNIAKKFSPNERKLSAVVVFICSQSHLRTKGDFPCPHLIFNRHGFRSSSEEFFESNLSALKLSESSVSDLDPDLGGQK
jgi:hypothetical protein